MRPWHFCLAWRWPLFGTSNPNCCTSLWFEPSVFSWALIWKIMLFLSRTDHLECEGRGIDLRVLLMELNHQLIRCSVGICQLGSISSSFFSCTYLCHDSVMVSPVTGLRHSAMTPEPTASSKTVLTMLMLLMMFLSIGQWFFFNITYLRVKDINQLSQISETWLAQSGDMA